MQGNEFRKIQGECSISRAFIARYAAEAALRTEGVAALEAGSLAMIKEQFGGQHEGRGILVHYADEARQSVRVTVFPIIYYGFVLTEVAYSIQENIKADLEAYTDLEVLAVDVHVKDIVEPGEDLYG